MTLTTSQPRPTNDDAPKIRRALAEGRTVQWCADAYGWPRHRIKSLATNTRGWLLDHETDRVRIFTTTKPEPETAMPTAPADAAPAADQDAQPVAIANLEILIRRGEASESAATRTAAKKARDAVEQLRQRVRDEETEKKTRAEISELETKLAAAKQKLATVKPSAARPRPLGLPDGVAPKQMRAWAAEHGVACPTHGRIPKTVIDTYRTAHGLTDGS